MVPFFETGTQVEKAAGHEVYMNFFYLGPRLTDRNMHIRRPGPGLPILSFERSSNNW